MSTQYDEMLDRAAEQIRTAQPNPAVVKAAADRVWKQIAGAGDQGAAIDAAEIVEIRGCEDYQALIPAYLADALPPARKILLEDHTGECVPCRRALKDAREGKTPIANDASESDKPRGRQGEKIAAMRSGRSGSAANFSRLAMAAMLVLALGVGFYTVSELMFRGAGATVQMVDGSLFRVNDGAQMLLQDGDVVREGDILRSGRGTGAILRLEDGSLVEVRERSQLSIDESRRGTTVELARGSVIVQAAEQRERHLYVTTEDCDVAVKGTIFSVNHGTKGSRVSVIEGEVFVQSDREEKTLAPGEQVTTHDALAAVPVEDEISWSRDIDRYLEMLEEVAEMQRELSELMRSDLRYDTRLLDLVPKGTVFYAGFPNMADKISQSHQVVQNHVQQSPMLQQWWTQNLSTRMIEPQLEDLMGKLGEFGQFLGDEMAVGVYLHGMEGFSGIGLAELKEPVGFLSFLEGLQAPDALQGMTLRLDDEQTALVRDPREELPEAEMYLWVHNDLVVITPDADVLAGVGRRVLDGEENPFVGGAFHEKIAELYADGTDTVIAADIGNVIGIQGGHFTRLGIDNVQTVLFEQAAAERSHHQMTVSFREARHGVAAWLAEPAPMASLDFITPNAKAVIAAVFQNPALMLDDLRGFGLTEIDDRFAEFKARHGVDLRDDFAAVLGGEIAFAFDGPLLPTPAWKAVIEVYDPVRFQITLEELLIELNDYLDTQGDAPITITPSTFNGLEAYEVDAGKFTFVYAFTDGYLVAVPNRGLLERALQARSSGYGFSDTRQFVELLPPDSRNNFSAIFYQDLGTSAQDFADKIAGGIKLSDEQRQALEKFDEQMGPTLGYAYGEKDRIVIAASSEVGLIRTMIFQALGVGNSMGIADVFESIISGS